MAPQLSRAQPVFLMRGTCGGLVACTSDQLPRYKDARAALQNHGVCTSRARFSARSTAGHETDWECKVVAQQSHTSRAWSSGHTAKVLVAMEDASTASGHTDDSGSERSARVCTDAGEDSLEVSQSFRGLSRPGGSGKSKRNKGDERHQKERLDEIELQRPLLVGPFKDFTDSLVVDVIRRFGGSVQRAQVMKGARSQSERSSLMLWFSNQVSVSVVESGEGPSVIIEDPVGGRTVVDNLQEVFLSGVEQMDKHICVQQAKKYFVPGPDALKSEDVNKPPRETQ